MKKKINSKICNFEYGKEFIRNIIFIKILFLLMILKGYLSKFYKNMMELNFESIL